MTQDELASVTLEHLRAIRATQADHGDELAAIRLELSAMGVSTAEPLIDTYSLLR